MKVTIFDLLALVGITSFFLLTSFPAHAFPGGDKCALPHKVYDCSVNNSETYLSSQVYPGTSGIPQIPSDCPIITPCLDADGGDFSSVVGVVQQEPQGDDNSDGTKKKNYPLYTSSFKNLTASGVVTAGVNIEAVSPPISCSPPYTPQRYYDLKFKIPAGATIKKVHLYFTDRSKYGNTTTPWKGNNYEMNFIVRPREERLVFQDAKNSGKEITCELWNATLPPPSNPSCMTFLVGGPSLHNMRNSRAKVNQIDKVFRVSLLDKDSFVQPNGTDSEGNSLYVIRLRNPIEDTEVFNLSVYERFGALLMVLYDHPKIPQSSVILHEGFDSASTESDWPNDQYSVINPLNIVFRNNYRPSGSSTQLPSIEVHTLFTDTVNHAIQYANNNMYNSMSASFVRWDGESSTITDPNNSTIATAARTGIEGTFMDSDGYPRDGASLYNNPIGVGRYDHDVEGFRNMARYYDTQNKIFKPYKMADPLILKFKPTSDLVSAVGGSASDALGLSIQPKIFWDKSLSRCSCVTLLGAVTLVPFPGTTIVSPTPRPESSRRVLLKN